MTKTEFVRMRVSPPQKKELSDYAQTLGISLSEFVLQASLMAAREGEFARQSHQAGDTVAPVAPGADSRRYAQTSLGKHFKGPDPK